MPMEYSEPLSDPLKSAAMRWTLLGCASLGLIIGIMTGMSVSPIVSVVVGLIFAFAGGSVIIMIKGRNAEDRIIIGQSIFALSLAALIGVALGVKVREGDWLQTMPQVAAYRFEGDISIDAIIDMYKNGISAKVIATVVKASQNRKSKPLANSDLVKLTAAKIPLTVIQTMLLGTVTNNNRVELGSNSKLFAETNCDKNVKIEDVLGNVR